MFNFFRFRKLNAFLSSAGVTGKSTEPVHLSKLESCSDSLFNLIFDEGRNNFQRLLEMLYEQQAASTRIKLLIVLHHLILEDRSYAERFLNYPKTEFKGLLIAKKPHENTKTHQTHRYTETAGDATLRGPETSVSVSRSCTGKKHIDDEFDYSDVNVYLHLYLVVPYLGHLLKICANYDLYEDAKHPPGTTFDPYRKSPQSRVQPYLAADQHHQGHPPHQIRAHPHRQVLHERARLHR
jgi:hypothetical protein